MKIIDAIVNIVLFLLGTTGLLVGLALTSLFVYLAFVLHGDGLTEACSLFAGTTGVSTVIYGVVMSSVITRSNRSVGAS